MKILLAPSFFRIMWQSSFFSTSSTSNTLLCCIALLGGVIYDPGREGELKDEKHGEKSIQGVRSCIAFLGCQEDALRLYHASALRMETGEKSSFVLRLSGASTLF